MAACAWWPAQRPGRLDHGPDLAGREQQALYETEIAQQKDLPPLGVLVTRLDRTGPTRA
ncbi:MAG: hypothetical protein U0Z44_01605 [Kouleothrix sp.]